jgi:hypothetical protein
MNKKWFVDVHNTIDVIMVKKKRKKTRTMMTDWKSKNNTDDQLVLELKRN